MPKTNVLTIRVPSDLKHRIETAAKEQGVSINQLAMYMFAREVSSLEEGARVSEFWQGYDRDQIEEEFDSVMPRIRRRRVPGWDRPAPARKGKLQSGR